MQEYLNQNLSMLSMQIQTVLDSNMPIDKKKAHLEKLQKWFTQVDMELMHLYRVQEQASSQAV